MKTRVGYYNEIQWKIGKKFVTSGNGSLCSDGWLHYYHDPILAIIMNQQHAKILNPRLFECQAEGNHLDNYGLKGGCTEMTLIREIQIPEVTVNHIIVFSILCAKQVYKDIVWNEWADNWLNNKDRSHTTAIAHKPFSHDILSDSYAAISAAFFATLSATLSDANSMLYNYYASISAISAIDAADDYKIDFISLAKEAMRYK